MSGYDNKSWGYLSSYVDKEEIEYVTGHGPQVGIQVSDTTTVDAVYAKLKKWTGMDVYKKADIPDHLHFRDHRNMFDLLMVSKGKDMVWATFSKLFKYLSSKIKSY